MVNNESSCENTLSAGTDVAGMQRYCLATQNGLVCFLAPVAILIDHIDCMLSCTCSHID